MDKKKEEEKLPALTETNSLLSLVAEFESVLRDKELKEQILSSDPLRIKFLTGGAGLVNIADQPTSEFLAIIFAYRNVCQYWIGKEVRCYSENGIKPEMDSSEVQCDYCGNCPLAAFGTAESEKGEKTRGKRCKHMVRLYMVLTPNLSKLPAIIHIPPTSVKTWKKYLTLMSSQLTPIHKFFTKIKIGATESGGYTVTCVEKFEQDRELMPEELKIVEFLRGMSKKVRVEREPEDYSSEETTNEPGK